MRKRQSLQPSVPNLLSERSFEFVSSIVMATVVVAGSEVVKTHNAIDGPDAATEAVTARMVVTCCRGSQYLTPGKMRGLCLTGPQANDIITSGDKSQRGRPFEIMVPRWKRSWMQPRFTSMTTSLPVRHQTPVGHCEGEGTAIHFIDKMQ